MALASVGVILSFAQYMSYQERPRSFFATYADAKAAGMFSKGWLPSYLPRSAKNINEGHDLDTNEVWASFEFDVSDIASVESECRLVVETLNGKKFLCPPFKEETATLIMRSDGNGYYARNQSRI